ncbi:kinase-like domain-containing protein [Pelagophyceae sp. CCMP2097]|nr:kinase-like domain-containing protein [Pelagophyceae sp. CCMP2097]|mmetsp:Transcript_26364/g.90660  ORF Transcript_26364/g.90660 Transcript_26364/m.90660 type:complete len:369 (+) Transcript_26364:154-1260(+)
MSAQVSGAARRAVAYNLARSLSKSKADRPDARRPRAAAPLRWKLPGQPARWPERSPSKFLEEFFPPTQLLGRGGFATVLKAKRIACGVDYALKVVDVDGDAADAEVASMTHIGPHPNLVPLHASWYERPTSKLEQAISRSALLKRHTLSEYSSSESESSDDGIIRRPPKWRLVMQLGLCAHGSLHDWLRARRETSPALAEERSIAVAVARGLRHVHEAHYAHLDLSPRNVLKGGDDWRIGDFGLAARFDDAANSTNGAPAYIAPERRHRLGVSRNEPNDLRAADVYSLGVILFELLTPFDSAMERVVALETLGGGGSLEALRGQHPHEARLIRAMTHSDPRARPTANDVLRSLCGDGEAIYGGDSSRV